MLGLEANQIFTDQSIRLSRGDRVFVYSDGLEPTLMSARHPAPKLPDFEAGIGELLKSQPQTMIEQLVSSLESAPGSLTKADDVSILVLDIAAK